MAVVDRRGHHALESGAFRVYAGGRQPDPKSEELTGTEVLSVEFLVEGERHRGM